MLTEHLARLALQLTSSLEVSCCGLHACFFAERVCHSPVRAPRHRFDGQSSRGAAHFFRLLAVAKFVVGSREVGTAAHIVHMSFPLDASDDGQGFGEQGDALFVVLKIGMEGGEIGQQTSVGQRKGIGVGTVEVSRENAILNGAVVAVHGGILHGEVRKERGIFQTSAPVDFRHCLQRLLCSLFCLRVLSRLRVIDDEGVERSGIGGRVFLENGQGTFSHFNRFLIVPLLGSRTVVGGEVVQRDGIVV